MKSKPAALNSGARIGIFVPSSPVKEPFRTKGVERVKEMGFIPVETDDILSNKGIVAKDPEKSIEEFMNFMRDDSIDALWAARGGYGSNYMLSYLDKVERLPAKVVIGSSDVSYLLWYLLDRFNMTVFYGPMLYSSIADNRGDVEQFLDVVTGRKDSFAVSGLSLLPGESEGVLTGGCMTNLVSLLGTQYLPELDDRIVLLEDVGERPFRLDRMLWQLCEAGVMGRVKGVALGNFPSCFLNDEEKEQFLKRTEEMLRKYSIPVIYDLKAGHGDNIKTLPLGCRCLVKDGSLTILERGVV